MILFLDVLYITLFLDENKVIFRLGFEQKNAYI